MCSNYTRALTFSDFSPSSRTRASSPTLTTSRSATVSSICLPTSAPCCARCMLRSRSAASSTSPMCTVIVAFLSTCRCLQQLLSPICLCVCVCVCVCSVGREHRGCHLQKPHSTLHARAHVSTHTHTSASRVRSTKKDCFCIHIYHTPRTHTHTNKYTHTHTHTHTHRRSTVLWSEYTLGVL